MSEIKLKGILSGGYGIIPKNLMKMELNKILGNKKGRNVKLILAYMLTYTGGGKNVCFPSIKTIAEDLEVSQDFVIESIQLAEKVVLLTKERMYPNDPMKHNNLYTLKIDENYSKYIRPKQNRSTKPTKSNYDLSKVEQNSNINNSNINNNIVVKKKNADLFLNKIKHLDHVYILQDEYNKLVEMYEKQTVDTYIERLNLYLTNNPQKQLGDRHKGSYKNLYRTLDSWIKKDGIRPKEIIPKCKIHGLRINPGLDDLCSECFQEKIDKERGRIK